MFFSVTVNHGKAVDIFIVGVGKPVRGSTKALPRRKAQSAAEDWIRVLPRWRVLQVCMPRARSWGLFYLTTIVCHFLPLLHCACERDWISGLI